MENIRTDGQMETLCDMCLVEQADRKCIKCDADMCEDCNVDQEGRCGTCWAKMVECIGCAERIDPDDSYRAGAAHWLCEGCMQDAEAYLGSLDPAGGDDGY